MCKFCREQIRVEITEEVNWIKPTYISKIRKDEELIMVREEIVQVDRILPLLNSKLSHIKEVSKIAFFVKNLREFYLNIELSTDDEDSANDITEILIGKFAEDYHNKIISLGKEEVIDFILKYEKEENLFLDEKDYEVKIEVVKIPVGEKLTVQDIEGCVFVVSDNYFDCYRYNGSAVRNYVDIEIQLHGDKTPYSQYTIFTQEANKLAELEANYNNTSDPIQKEKAHLAWLSFENELDNYLRRI